MSSTPRTKEKLFYGWVVVAATSVIAAMVMGTRMSYGVFFKSIQGEFDLTRAATSSVYSVHMLIGAVFAVVGGWAFDRYGPRPVVFFMGLLTGVSLMLTSRIGSFWQIYLSYSLLLAAGAGATYTVLTAAVSKWFDRKRGLVIGLIMSGGRFGTLVAAPLAASLIAGSGWRTAYAVLGLIIMLVVVPVSRLLRRDPAEMGLLPDGATLKKTMEQPSGAESNALPPDISLKRATRTRNYWLILAINFLFSFCLNLLMTHIVPYVTDTGISIVEGSIVLSLMTGVGILANVLAGRIADVTGIKTPAIICAFVVGGALVWLAMGAETLWAFYLFAAVFGLFSGGLGITPVTLVSDFFRGPSLGIIMGTVNVGFATGAAVGPSVGGLIFDVTGSYFTAFLLAAGAVLAVALLLAFIRREGGIAPDGKKASPADIRVGEPL